MDALQLIAEPRRRAILELIWTEERAAGEIAAQFDITFGAVSQHLAALRRAKLVSVRREGTHRFYRARPERLGPLRAVVEAMWSDKLDALAEAVETGHS